jgi:hypothetical protein
MNPPVFGCHVSELKGSPRIAETVPDCRLSVATVEQPL